MKESTGARSNLCSRKTKGGVATSAKCADFREVSTVDIREESRFVVITRDSAALERGTDIEGDRDVVGSKSLREDRKAVDGAYVIGVRGKKQHGWTITGTRFVLAWRTCQRSTKRC